MAETGIFEVRCDRCQTSFAPEWKQCVHCGGPLGRGGLFGAFRSSGAGQAEVAEDGTIRPDPFDAVEESDEIETQGRGRNLVWMLTVAAAMLMSVMRSCGG